MSDHLRAILARYPASIQPSDEPIELGNAGGLSGSQFWRFTTALGPVVAHAWPAEGPPRAVLEQIHAWLGELNRLSYIPVPLRAIDGGTLQEAGGRLWEVVPWLPGVSAASLPIHESRVRLVFSTLASVHTALARHQQTAASPGLLARRAEVRALMNVGFMRFERAIEEQPGDPLTPLARRWLTEAQARAAGVAQDLSLAVETPVPLQPCLRDARPDHFLFEDDRLTGLIDFGAMGVESVAADLARLLAEWLGGARDLPWRTLALESYQERRPLGSAEARLIAVFDASSALLIGARWVGWHFLEHRRFDDPLAVGRGLARGLERLERLEVSSSRIIRPDGDPHHPRP